MLKKTGFQYLGIFSLIIFYVFLLALVQLMIQSLVENEGLRPWVALGVGAIYVAVVYFLNIFFFNKTNLEPPAVISLDVKFLRNLVIGLIVGCLILFPARLVMAFQTGNIEYLSLEFGIEIFVFSLLPAVTEEVIFRGSLLNFFTQKKKRYLGLVISALLFALVHLANAFVGKQMDLSIMFNLILGGFCLGLTYLYFGLVSAIALHFTWNFLSRGFMINYDDWWYVNLMIILACIYLFYLDRKSGSKRIQQALS